MDTWHLDQSFPDTGDASSASLWLKSIQNTGKANSTTAAMPPVVFGGVQLSNHVEGRIRGRCCCSGQDVHQGW
ncbi:hypothetical protein ACIPC1_20780 [Streptomyces sp. NPDC087263]|uniref:hypothetical protein n=1 Tax=Streptomyces sp. NPDC087263 TaxID=3365773 RepID=UPI003828CFDC